MERQQPCLLVGGFIIQRSRRSTGLARFALVAVLVVPTVALAAVTLPHTFTNGTIADATEVNANFEALASEVNSSKTLRSRIGAAGTPSFGTGGFTVLHSGTGLYRIDYDDPYAFVPTPMAFGAAVAGVTVNSICNTASFTCFSITDSSGVAVDSDFYFMVVGIPGTH